MKRYVDIQRLKDKYAMAFKEGEHIVCQEKLDGSNSQILFDPETGTLKAFSRRNELTSESTLQGFWDFVQTLDAKSFGSILGDRYIIFGEWLVRHTIHYPEDKMRQFYVFDVWDTVTEEYLPWERTFKDFALPLGLKTVPVFYDGKFTTWNEVIKLVGKTEIGGEPTGEGIVVKSQDRLDNKFSGTPSYVKIVAEEFSEVHQSKPQKEIDPEKLAAKQAAQDLAETIITQRRVQKTLEKLIDYGDIPVDWDEKTMGLIAKILPKEIYNDCVKEENEIVQSVENFGKYCSAIVMKYVKELLKKKYEV